MNTANGKRDDFMKLKYEAPRLENLSLKAVEGATCVDGNSAGEATWGCRSGSSPDDGTLGDCVSGDSNRLSQCVDGSMAFGGGCSNGARNFL